MSFHSLTLSLISFFHLISTLLFTYLLPFSYFFIFILFFHIIISIVIRSLSNSKFVLSFYIVYSYMCLRGSKFVLLFYIVYSCMCLRGSKFVLSFYIVYSCMCLRGRLRNSLSASSILGKSTIKLMN